MANLSTALPNYGFPHQFDRIEFFASSTCSITLSCSIGAVSFRLTPDASGRIVLNNFAQLLRDFTADGVPRMFTLTWDSGSYTFKVLPCRLTLSQSAYGFSARHFMTLQTGRKPTYLGAPETVTMYASNNQGDRFAIALLWVDPLTGQAQTQVLDGNSDTEDGAIATGTGYVQIDVSPASFAAPAPGLELHSYTVSAGNRSQEFELRRVGDAKPVTLLFRNCFGIMESFHLFGEVTQELKPTRSAASFSGLTRNFRVVSVPEYTAQTGLLRPGCFALFEDLCTSDYVLLPAENNAELCITDCDFKLSSDRYEPQQGTITWRYARQARHYEVVNDAITFDDSFDDTFK